MSDAPSGWVRTTLGEVASWGSGGTPTATNPSYYGGDIPWAVIGDLNDSVVKETAAKITMRGLSTSSAKVVDAGTVLIAMYGSIGRLGVAGTRMATNQAIAFVNGLPDLADNKFLFWFLQWQRPLLVSAAKGATQQNISQTILKGWPIVLPPLSEQLLIVAAIEEQLSRLDSASTMLQRVDARLRQLRAAVFRDIFTHENEVATAKVPLSTVVESSIGGLWGKAQRSSTAPVPVTVVRGADFRAWDTQRASAAPQRWVNDRELCSRELSIGDLVLEVSGGGPNQPVGRTVLIDEMARRSVSTSLITSNFCRKLSLSEEVVPRFLWYQLVWLYESGGTVRFQRATTNIRNLTVGDFLAETIIYLPDRGQQIGIVKQLDSVLDGFIRLGTYLSAQSRTSRALRSAILKKALEGQLAERERETEFDER